MLKSRRKAREAALRALYEMEVGKARLPDALNSLRANADFPPELLSFAELLLNGVHDRQSMLDDKLASMVRECSNPPSAVALSGHRRCWINSCPSLASASNRD